MKLKLAIIGGTSFLESTLFEDWDPVSIQTEFTTVSAWEKDDVLFVQRHGIDGNVPPHQVDYQANIAAIYQCEYTKIVAINSTGSLKPEIAPGSLVIPHDYFNLFNVVTFFDKIVKFTVPGMDENLRRFLLATAERHGIAVRPEGVYFQVQGPILETPTEIRFARQIGDILGMTMTKEAILAKELELGYASICVVDNYANGIADKPLSLEEIANRRQINLATLETYLGHLLADFPRFFTE